MSVLVSASRTIPFSLVLGVIMHILQCEIQFYLKLKFGYYFVEVSGIKTSTIWKLRRKLTPDTDLKQKATLLYTVEMLLSYAHQISRSLSKTKQKLASNFFELPNPFCLELIAQVVSHHIRLGQCNLRLFNYITMNSSNGCPNDQFLKTLRDRDCASLCHQNAKCQLFPLSMSSVFVTHTLSIPLE